MNGRTNGRPNEVEPIAKELRAIRTVIEDLLILECARAGMTNASVRAVAKLDNNRISRIARHVKAQRQSVEEAD